MNNTVLITGGAMGIGLATAKRFLAKGDTVILWDINSAALTKTVDELKSSGKVFSFTCDVTQKEEVYEAARRTLETAGRVDILVNNAGWVIGGNFLDRSDEEWEKTIDINFTSLIYTTRAFLPGMYERNYGHVVNISSASSTLGVAGLAVYAGTKWAVHGFTESLRFEAYNVGKTGVKFSTVHPSYIATGLFEGAELGFPAKYIAPLIKNHDVIAKAIVEDSVGKGRYSPKRPLTVHLNTRLRAMLPDSWFQRLVIFLGIHNSMKAWKGRNKS